MSYLFLFSTTLILSPLVSNSNISGLKLIYYSEICYLITTGKDKLPNKKKNYKIYQIHLESNKTLKVFTLIAKTEFNRGLFFLKYIINLTIVLVFSQHATFGFSLKGDLRTYMKGIHEVQIKPLENSFCF